jgi:hypothetical protein
MHPTLKVAIVGDRDDARVATALEAVQYWNRELGSLGLRTRFTSVVVPRHDMPNAMLARASHSNSSELAGVVRREFDDVRADIVIALSDGEFPSYTLRGEQRGEAVVAIRSADVPPLSNTNVARNVIAHELGHVLGLDHNGDPQMLMCGRPAPCRPDVFASDHTVFFPLTAAEKEQLQRRWR